MNTMYLPSNFINSKEKKIQGFGDTSLIIFQTFPKVAILIFFKKITIESKIKYSLRFKLAPGT